MGTQYTRQLVEDARAALADDADQTASGISSFFDRAHGPDRDLLARERIRREIVREIFDADSDATEASAPAFARRLAKLLRLS